jgi:dihydrolipoamide dehydrogenase
MADDRFDVVVIGAGPAGENAAGRCANGGLRTAIVEVELVGGECSYWGCIPSKTLIRPGDVIAAARRVPGAVEAVTGKLDAEAAFARRNWITGDWNDEGAVPWLDENDITLVRGRGRLAGARVVAVEQPDGSTRTLQAQSVILATGTSPLIPPVPGLADIKPWDNRAITSAKEVPRRLLVLGGGAVGCEMGQAFRRLGAEEVTIIEGAARLMPREEPFAGDELAKAFTAEGMAVFTGIKLAAVRRDGDAVIARLEDGRELTGDKLLCAVGRRTKTGDVGLDTVGLTPGEPVEVDDQLRARGVEGGWLYAIGDCNGRAPLTHMGKYQGRLAGDVILGKPVRDIADNDRIPRVTFTDPQICAVGFTEAQARERGLDVRVVTVPLEHTSAAATLGQGIAGTGQLVVDETRHIVIGATFTGPGLQELLHSASIAIVAEVPLETLWHAVPSFPTLSEIWLKLLEAYGL